VEVVGLLVSLVLSQEGRIDAEQLGTEARGESHMASAAARDTVVDRNVLLTHGGRPPVMCPSGRPASPRFSTTRDVIGVGPMNIGRNIVSGVSGVSISSQGQQ
jgi:hypothetical protein